MSKHTRTRRSVLAGLGAVAAAGAAGTVAAPVAEAQSNTAPFAPALFEPDAWMSAMRGSKQRVT